MYVYIQRKLVKPKKYIYVTYSRENTSGKSDSEKECSFSFVTSSGSHYILLPNVWLNNNETGSER